MILLAHHSSFFWKEIQMEINVHLLPPKAKTNLKSNKEVQWRKRPFKSIFVLPSRSLKDFLSTQLSSFPFFLWLKHHHKWQSKKSLAPFAKRLWWAHDKKKDSAPNWSKTRMPEGKKFLQINILFFGRNPQPQKVSFHSRKKMEFAPFLASNFIQRGLFRFVSFPRAYNSAQNSTPDTQRMILMCSFGPKLLVRLASSLCHGRYIAFLSSVPLFFFSFLFFCKRLVFLIVPLLNSLYKYKSNFFISNVQIERKNAFLFFISPDLWHQCLQTIGSDVVRWNLSSFGCILHRWQFQPSHP